MTPAAVLKTGSHALLGCGLSKRKSEYILDLAAKFKEKQVHPDKWSTMADEDVIAELSAQETARAAKRPRERRARSPTDARTPRLGNLRERRYRLRQTAQPGSSNALWRKDDRGEDRHSKELDAPAGSSDLAATRPDEQQLFVSATTGDSE